MASTFELELECLTKEYEQFLSQSKYPDASDVISDVKVNQMLTRCLVAVERAAGNKSTYFKRAMSIEAESGNNWDRLASLIGVVDSLLHNIREGYLKSFEELIHGDVFSDFLEMASHLLASGYKDAAAVIGGSTLEAHLKQLCIKNGIPTDNAGKPKKADTINSDLSGANIYSKLDQKNVTAWLGLRNNAAHGDYSAYQKEQVNLLLTSIQDFITRVPA